MGKLLRRGWRYLVAALSGKLDERTQPLGIAFSRRADGLVDR